jgi:hypothetical protein
MVENHEQQEVKQRIAALLMSDDIPDARDIVIVSLAEACGLLEHIFSKDEIQHARARIDQIVNLDLIGQAVRSTIQHIREQAVALTSYPS